MIKTRNVKKQEVFTLKNKGRIDAVRPIHIAEELSWNYGDDVVVYDVRNNTPFVSYYIVASASNDHRLRALVETSKEALYANYKDLKHTEGKNESKWVLLDAGDVVIQLFTKEERKRVAFDELYQNVPHKIVKAEEEPNYRKRKKETKEAL